MKKLHVLVCIAALLFVPSLLAAEKDAEFVCVSEKEAKRIGYNIDNMRSEYPPMNSIGNEGAFPDQRAEVVKFIDPISRKLKDIARQGNGEMAPTVFATLLFSKDGTPLFLFFEGLSPKADRDAFCSVAEEAVFYLQSDTPYSYSFTLRIQ